MVPQKNMEPQPILKPLESVGTGTSPKLKNPKISNLVGDFVLIFVNKNSPKLCGIDRSRQELSIAPSLASQFSFLASGELGKVGQLSRISLLGNTKIKEYQGSVFMETFVSLWSFLASLGPVLGDKICDETLVRA